MSAKYVIYDANGDARVVYCLFCLSEDKDHNGACGLNMGNSLAADRNVGLMIRPPKRVGEK